MSHGQTQLTESGLLLDDAQGGRLRNVEVYSSQV